MGLQGMEELQLHRGGGVAVGAAATDDDQAAGGGKKKAAAVWIALPLIRPVKVARRRLEDDGTGSNGSVARREDEEGEEEEEEVTTPRGEGCRIPVEAGTCPPAPKKARTAVAIVADRRCNRDDGEVTEYYRVPADLDSVFVVVGRVAEAN